MFSRKTDCDPKKCFTISLPESLTLSIKLHDFFVCVHVFFFLFFFLVP